MRVVVGVSVGVSGCGWAYVCTPVDICLAIYADFSSNALHYLVQGCCVNLYKIHNSFLLQ